MKIQTLKEGEIYTSKGYKWKTIEGKLHFKSTEGAWIRSSREYNDAIQIDFELYKPEIKKTKIEFVEYYNTVYECLQWIKKDYVTNLNFKPTGKTTTREVEL